MQMRWNPTEMQVELYASGVNASGPMDNCINAEIEILQSLR